MQTAATILFVDDEKHVTKYFKKALSHEFTIETAESVKDAIAILDDKNEQIAVVITDQRMPKQLGIELLQHTQRNYPNIVRMLTTAFCDFDSAISAINKAEVFRYIPKPWDIDSLEKTLNQALYRFNTLNENTTNTSKEHLLHEVQNDCHHWLMYALHAYGDVNVYTNGIEALTCRYGILINSRFSQEEATLIDREMNRIIANDFLNATILDDLKSQSRKGFGLSDNNTKSH